MIALRNMRPEDRETLIRNVSDFTGIAADRLATLGDDTSGIEGLKEEAAAFLQQSSDEQPERVHRRAAMALDSLAAYLRTRRWGYARSESIVAGPPPSPYLADLIQQPVHAGA